MLEVVPVVVAQTSAYIVLTKVLYYLNNKLEIGFAFQMGEWRSRAWCKGRYSSS